MNQQNNEIFYSIDSSSLCVSIFSDLMSSQGATGNYSISSSYIDKNSVSSWAENAVAWGINQGLISGHSGNTIAPQGTAHVQKLL